MAIVGGRASCSASSSQVGREGIAYLALKNEFDLGRYDATAEMTRDVLEQMLVDALEHMLVCNE
jgi:hypothetical protein